MTHSYLTWVSSHVPRAGQGRVFTPTLLYEREIERKKGGGRIGKRLHLGCFYTDILFLLSRLLRAEHVDFRVGYAAVLAVGGMRVRVK